MTELTSRIGVAGKSVNRARLERESRVLLFALPYLLNTGIALAQCAVSCNGCVDGSSLPDTGSVNISGCYTMALSEHFASDAVYTLTGNTTITVSGNYDMDFAIAEFTWTYQNSQTASPCINGQNAYSLTITHEGNGDIILPGGVHGITLEGQLVSTTVGGLCGQNGGDGGNGGSVCVTTSNGNITVGNIICNGRNGGFGGSAGTSGQAGGIGGAGGDGGSVKIKAIGGTISFSGGEDIQTMGRPGNNGGNGGSRSIDDHGDGDDPGGQGGQGGPGGNGGTVVLRADAFGSLAGTITTTGGVGGGGGRGGSGAFCKWVFDNEMCCNPCAGIAVNSTNGGSGGDGGHGGAGGGVCIKDSDSSSSLTTVELSIDTSAGDGGQGGSGGQAGAGISTESEDDYCDDCLFTPCESEPTRCSSASAGAGGSGGDGGDAGTITVEFPSSCANDLQFGLCMWTAWGAAGGCGGGVTGHLKETTALCRNGCTFVLDGDLGSPGAGGNGGDGGAILITGGEHVDFDDLTVRLGGGEGGEGAPGYSITAQSCNEELSLCDQAALNVGDGADGLNGTVGSLTKAPGSGCISCGSDCPSENTDQQSNHC